MANRKIAYITLVPNPVSGAGYLCQSVNDVLIGTFPELEVEHIEAMTLLRRQKFLPFLNLFSVMKEYGLDTLFR